MSWLESQEWSELGAVQVEGGRESVEERLVLEEETALPRDCPVRGQELDLIIHVGLFQLRIVCHPLLRRHDSIRVALILNCSSANKLCIFEYSLN